MGDRSVLQGAVAHVRGALAQAPMETAVSIGACRRPPAARSLPNRQAPPAVLGNQRVGNLVRIEVLHSLRRFCVENLVSRHRAVGRMGSGQEENVNQWRDI